MKKCIQINNRWYIYVLHTRFIIIFYNPFIIHEEWKKKINSSLEEVSFFFLNRLSTTVYGDAATMSFINLHFLWVLSLFVFFFFWVYFWVLFQKENTVHLFFFLRGRLTKQLHGFLCHSGDESQGRDMWSSRAELNWRRSVGIFSSQARM